MGFAWLIFLDGSTHFGFVVEKSQDNGDPNDLIKAVEDHFHRGKYFYYRLADDKKPSYHRYPDCKGSFISVFIEGNRIIITLVLVIMMTQWSEWLSSTNYSSKCDKKWRHRIVIVEEAPKKDRLCPPTLECNVS